jgi:hypothetical protein
VEGGRNGGNCTISAENKDKQVSERFNWNLSSIVLPDLRSRIYLDPCSSIFMLLIDQK